MPATTAPAWAELSEDGIVTIDGRERDVVDHYGTLAKVPFPGHASRGGQLPTLNIDVSRCDVIDENDSTTTHAGPYVATVAVSEQHSDSTLSSLDDLEKFARALLATAQAVREVLANDARSIAEEVA